MKSSPYAIDKLMEQTRKLAAQYRAKTGQVLPVTSELAQYDVQSIFQFNPPDDLEQGLDFLGSIDGQAQKIQVKSRVIFDSQKSGVRIGQFNPKGAWDYVLLVLYDADYLVTEVYGMHKELLMDSISQNKRGAISVAKFKAIGQLIWTPEFGFDSESYTKE